MSTLPNSTFIPSYDTCSSISSSCPIEATLYAHWFTKPGNLIFAVIFALCLIVQLYLLFRYRSYSFTFFLGTGTLLELIGYLSRYQLALNPWDLDVFSRQLTTLILAPTLIAAALSITFKHMVLYYGVEASVLKPKLYPWIFLGTDVVSIAIQVVGAAMSTSDNPSTINTATIVLTLGVAFQAANMLFCGGLMVLYWFRLRKGNHTRQRPEDASSRREDKRLKMYIHGMAVSYVLVLIRCFYRIPEMAGGWGGELMQDETTFLVLDGAMVAVAVLIQTILHPSIFFPAMKNNKAAAKVEKKAAKAERKASKKARKGGQDVEALELKDRA